MPGLARSVLQEIKITRWPVEVEQSYARGIIRDTPRAAIPAGGVYDAADYFLDQPGRAYGRGGFAFQSSVIGTNTNKAVTALGEIPISASAPTVVALVNGHLWDVTAGGGGTDLGSCTLQPICNLPLVQTAGSQLLVFPASDGTTAPKKIYDSSGATLANLGGSPPAGKIACVHLSYLLLGNTAANPNRLYFSPVPDVEGTWDTTDAWIDFDDPITGLASVGGVLLVWSQSRLWRVLGTVPPGTTGENMQVQPVASVGCQDARSIQVSGNTAYFASSEGIYETNGAGVTSLTDKPDATGISSWWRDTFASNFNANTVIASGIFRNRWLLVSVLSPGSAYATLAGGPQVAASMTISGSQPPFTGYLAQLTAITTGTGGNSITVTINLNAGSSGIVVSGNDITFNSTGSSISLATIQSLVAGSPAASALISVGPWVPAPAFHIVPTVRASVSKTNLTGGSGSAAGSATTLVCNLSDGTWQRFTNSHSYMYTAHQVAAHASDLLGAWAADAAVVDFANVFQYAKSSAGAVLQQDAGTPTTGGTLAVTPFLETRMIGSGPGLKAYGHAHVTYNLIAASGTPTMAVSRASGVEAESPYAAVSESPLAATTQVTRKRFTVNTDAQAVSYQLQQIGASGFTELYLIETEVRSYDVEADGP